MEVVFGVGILILVVVGAVIMAFATRTPKVATDDHWIPVDQGPLDVDTEPASVDALREDETGADVLPDPIVEPVKLKKRYGSTSDSLSTASSTPYPDNLGVAAAATLWEASPAKYDTPVEYPAIEHKHVPSEHTHSPPTGPSYSSYDSGSSSSND